ncbi:MAG: hypothetical protein ACOYL5_05545 [Phototrophicaceae bacterium]|jgi:hypothetical protein
MFEKREFSVDAEHDSLRLVVVLAFIISGIAGFAYLSFTFQAGGINILAIFGSLIIAAGVSSTLERALKKRWPSGKVIEIEPTRIALLHQGQVKDQVQKTEASRLMLWRFTVSRRTRVPKGWFMVATAVEQDDPHLAVYTLMSPQMYETFDIDNRFKVLEKPNAGVEADELRLAGEQRRLMRAESLRWHDGVEMTADDFMIYFGLLDKVFAA